jgi:hypothetical protein
MSDHVKTLHRPFFLGIGLVRVDRVSPGLEDAPHMRITFTKWSAPILATLAQTPGMSHHAHPKSQNMSKSSHAKTYP